MIGYTVFMMNFLRVLLIVVFVIGCASPASAASLEKKRLVSPTISTRVLTSIKQGWKTKRIFGQAMIANEISCGNVFYRLWSVPIREGELMVERAFVYEAATRGKTKWRAETVPVSLMGDPQAAHRLITCAGDQVVNVRDSLWGQGNTGLSEQRLLSFSTFEKKSAWSLSRKSRWSFWGRVDGLDQQVGVLRKSPRGSVEGDSRIFFVERGELVSHRPPWYRDLAAPELANVSLAVEFYRLSNGYGVREEITTQTEERQLKFYRIYDGEARYHEEEYIPYVSGNPGYYLEGDASGVVLKGLTQPIRVHGFSQICPAQSYLNCGEYTSWRGSVIRETSDKLYLRYQILVDQKKPQYWEAVVQK